MKQTMIANRDYKLYRHFIQFTDKLQTKPTVCIYSTLSGLPC